MLRFTTCILVFLAVSSSVSADEYYHLEDGRALPYGGIWEFFLDEDFDELEIIADDLRRNKTRFSGGAWCLNFFYQELNDPSWYKAKNPEGAFRNSIETWVEKYPDSVTWRIVQAGFYQRLAFKHRGTTFARDVTEKGFERFFRYQSKSWEALVELEGMPVKDPAVYDLALECAMHLEYSARAFLIETADGAFDLPTNNSSMDLLSRIFNSGVKVEPLYYQLYYGRARSLLQRWGGRPGELEKFCARATDSTARWIDEAMYARLFWYAVDHIGANTTMFAYEFDWKRVQQGHIDSIAQHPKSEFWPHHYTYSACLFEEKDLASELFEVNNGHNYSVWYNDTKHSRWYHWATATSEFPLGGVLEYALVFERNDILKDALEQGESPHKKDEYGLDMLARSIRNDNFGAAKLLLKHGARFEGSRAPYYAMKSSTTERLAFLFENGLTLEAHTRGDNVLHHCIRYGTPENLEYLFELGADPNRLTHDGKTPFTLAAERGDPHLFDILIKHGADLSLQPGGKNLKKPSAGGR